MMGRTGVVVLGLVAAFIAVAVILRPVAREYRAPASQPPEAVPTSPEPVPVAASEPEDVPAAEAAPGLVIEVVNSAGKGLRGARILDRWKHAAPLGTTDESGIVTIPFATLQYDSYFGSGSTRFRVEHDDYAPRFERVPRSASRVRITLRGSAIIDLEVVNRDGAPLADADVRVDETESNYLSHPAHPAMRAWKTDEHGRVRVTGIPAGAMVIRAQAKGYEEKGTFVVAQEGEPRSVRLVLNRGRILNVVVRSTGGGPVANAKVEFSDGSTWGMSSTVMGGYQTWYWMRRTDKNGAASFESLPAAKAKGMLRASSPRHPKVSKLVELNPDVTEVEMTLEAGGTLSVDAVDPAGESIACRIAVSGQAVESHDPANQKEKGAGEKAVFEGLSPSHPVNVSVYRNEGMIHIETGIAITASQTREVTIRVLAQCKVSFTARDRMGQPVPGQLDITRIKGRLGSPVPGRQGDYLSYQGRIGEDGTGEMSLLFGVYKVLFMPYAGARIEKELRVEGDTTAVLEVDSGASISGIVVDPADTPLSNVNVRWQSENAFWFARTDADGRFLLKRITGASGKISINLTGVSFETYAGPPPTGEMRFMFPLATLRGRVVRPDGAPGLALVYASAAKMDRWEDDQIPPISTNLNGSFEMRLPCGVWNVRAFGEGADPNPKPVQIDLSSPGNVVDVVFPLQSPKSP